MFSFEKENQKTFIRFPFGVSKCRQPPENGKKSFCFFFFRKRSFFPSPFNMSL